MAGKPTISADVHEQIRALFRAGMRVRSIMAEVGCSKYTVMKAIDPHWVETERVRQRMVDAARASDRAQSPAYIAYQQAYSTTDDYRAQSRERMRRLRADRREKCKVVTDR